MNAKTRHGVYFIGQHQFNEFTDSQGNIPAPRRFRGRASHFCQLEVIKEFAGAAARAGTGQLKATLLRKTNQAEWGCIRKIIAKMFFQPGIS
ncbi:MAG: hypothetical protein ACREOO_02740 [bacterium]